MKNPPCDIDMLYDRYSRRLYHTSLRIVGSAMDAEEVMHDTLLKFARQPEPPQSVPQVEAWLVRTCVRGSIDRIRGRKKSVFSFSDLGSAPLRAVADAEVGWSGFLNDASVETTCKIRQVRAALETLSARYRLILSLFLFEGYDHEEIAGITGLRVSTVRTMYVRAKMKLREKLRDNG